LANAAVAAPVPSKLRQLDFGLVAGIAVAALAMIAGLVSTGIDVRYFFHPTGAFIVLGGNLGVTLITTPPRALYHSARRSWELLFAAPVDRPALIDEIVRFARITRRDGLLAVESLAPQCSNEFLGNALLLALDVKDRPELQAALEMDLRLRERQGEADAKALEVAGGFAPTIGILGTTLGLVEILRQFSNLQAVGYGIGTAFVSTIYGLALANLVLLPIAHRIRARVAGTFEVQELMVEGVLHLVDRVHPSLIRLKLQSFLRETPKRDAGDGAQRLPVASGVNG
jgi:chemotaxis protein MotA